MLHIKRRTGQLAVQQIPVVPLLILSDQPAVHQPQTLAVFRHRQLRTAHQHQRIVLQLFTAHPGEGGIQLRQNPLRLRVAAVLQTSAGGLIDQAVAMLPEKGAPCLLAVGVHRAFDVRQRVGFLQQREPVARHLRIGLFTRAYQPDQLLVEALHETVVQARRNVP